MGDGTSLKKNTGWTSFEACQLLPCVAIATAVLPAASLSTLLGKMCAEKKKKKKKERNGIMITYTISYCGDMM